MIKKVLIILASSFLLMSCASKTQQNVQVQSPVQTQVAEPDPKVAEPQIQPEKPVISKELQDLRDTVKRSDFESAKNLAHQIIDREPEGTESPEALRTLAFIARSENNLSLASLYVSDANRIQPDQLETLYLIAQIAHEQNHDDDAVKVLNQCIEKFPEDSRSYIFKAKLLLSYLDIERALDVASKAYQLDGQSCDVNVVYADTLYASQKYEEAANQYVKAQSLCTLTEASLKNLAKLYEVNLQDSKKACDIYTKLAEMDASNPYYKASRDYQCGL